MGSDPSGMYDPDERVITLTNRRIYATIRKYTKEKQNNPLVITTSTFLDKLAKIAKGGKYTYGKYLKQNQYLCDTFIAYNMPKRASSTGMTKMFNNNAIVKGTIKDIGGYANLIPGMIVGQGDWNSTVNHGGVYMGFFAINEGDEPGYVVAQSVSSKAGVPGRPQGGPILTYMNAKWNIWMWHSGEILSRGDDDIY